ncbi:MAG: alcohol dehydrogenase catalytic domain-containing protein [Thermoleophilia bacterium]|nr:alcohol dehydrogenase catalytic domain-containing protein [Thermoleophilia bacterium]
MKAVVLHGPGDVRVDDVAEPSLLDPGDAIVRVAATAICGADLFPYHGLTPGFEAGTVLGHEFAGVVHEVGPAVERIRLGQRVVNGSMTRDGTCAYCRLGLPTQCEGRALFGYSGVYPRLDGGQAELVRVPGADLVLEPLPDSISDEAGTLIADILPTGWGAVVRGGVRAGELCCVVGCGPVGLMAVLAALHHGARVLAVDGIAARRELARSLGAEAAAPDEAAAAVAAAGDGLGAHVVIEAAGTRGALDAALPLARGRGTVSVVGAHFESDYPLDNLRMFERELTLRFTIGDPTNDRAGLLGLLGTGELDPTGVITHRLPLADAAEAYRLFDAREATKVVLTP